MWWLLYDDNKPNTNFVWMKKNEEKKIRLLLHSTHTHKKKNTIRKMYIKINDIDSQTALNFDSFKYIQKKKKKFIAIAIAITYIHPLHTHTTHTDTDK